ncbi:MAG: hypothetical protein FP820_09870 [Sulfurimonas sp.]|jgi:hypothetical protein|nr:hypothetical protein [Sulfurimonas sp.]MBU3939583.1 hypothetical protein [bacterium]MBU4023984.1 hypothetical protein [bacterium]
MGTYVPKKIKKQAEQMIKSFFHVPSKSKREKFSELVFLKRKKQAIKLIEITKKQNNLSFLESRYNSTSKCQVIWGEWSLLLKSNDPEYLEYDKVSFDLTVDLPNNNQIYKFFYLVFSKHALERLLERAETECKNSYEMRNYLDSILETIILRCLEIWENNVKLEKAEGYEVVNDLYLPIAMEKGRNIRKETCHSFTIKTVMPTSYKKNLEKQPGPKENIFAYEDLLIPEEENLDRKIRQQFLSKQNLLRIS